VTGQLPAPCDRAAALSVTSGGDTEHPRWILVATIAASSLAFIDGSVVNVALPAIGRSFTASAADLQWTINAYLLPLSALLLLGGAAGDHFGRRSLLIVGTTIFGLASILCALAPDASMMFVGRALQGLGAALLMPNSLAILGDAFSGEARGRAIGTWASIGAIASAVGPPLGGWLVGAIGWRAIFLVNLPVAVIAIAVTWRFAAESKERAQPLDWLGAGLETLALGLLTWGLTIWSNDRHLATAPLMAGAAGLISLALFVFHERRRGERAMMPLSLFASTPFVGLTVMTFLLYGALGGLLVLLPYILITGGYAPVEAGFALLPLPIGIGAASRLMGRITESIGPRFPLSLGPIVTGIGFALLVRLDPHASYWQTVFPGIAVIALGMAGCVAPLTTAVLSSVDRHHTGPASGFNSAIARTGGLVATALSGAVIVQAGAALLAAFHFAVIAFAGLAVLSGVAAFATLGSDRRSTT